MDIIKPARLRPGDTVGIVAPSNPVKPDERAAYERGLSALDDFGLKVKVGAHVLDRHYYSAGTRRARIEDFNTMWADPDVKMVMMTQGGLTANHLLDGLDYEAMRQNPKLFSGFSDGTTLTTAIHARTGLVTFYGPDLMWMFGQDICPAVRENFRKTLFEGQVGRLAPNPDWMDSQAPDLSYQGWRCIRGGKTSGRLQGGHVGVMTTTLLAGYVPKFDGAILFLEGTDRMSTLDRQFTALRLYGVFEQISGLVIGWFHGREMDDPADNREVADMVLEVTTNYSFPILEIGELGHYVENYTFPVGCQATLDADNKILSIDESPVV